MPTSPTGIRWGLDAVMITAHTGSFVTPVWQEIAFVDLLVDLLAAETTLDFVHSAELKMDLENEMFELTNEMFSVGHGVKTGSCELTLTCDAGDINSLVWALGKSGYQTEDNVTGTDDFYTLTGGVVIPQRVSILLKIDNPHESTYSDYVYLPNCQAKGNLASLMLSRKERRTVDVEFICHASNQRAASGDALDMCIEASGGATKPGSPFKLMTQYG